MVDDHEHGRIYRVLDFVLTPFTALGSMILECHQRNDIFDYGSQEEIDFSDDGRKKPQADYDGLINVINSEF